MEYDNGINCEVISGREGVGSIKWGRFNAVFLAGDDGEPGFLCIDLPFELYPEDSHEDEFDAHIEVYLSEIVDDFIKSGFGEREMKSFSAELRACADKIDAAAKP